MGAFAVQVALFRRETDPAFAGERIDLALYEALFRLVEWQVIAYDQLGMIAHRVGNQLAFAPAAVINTYATSDHDWIVVTSATVRSVVNVAKLLGEPADDYARLEQQLARRDRLDTLLREWIAVRPAEEALARMAEFEVVASRIFNIEDIVNDPTYNERQDIITVTDPVLGPVRMQAVIPKLDAHPGSVWRTAPALGEDNEVVLKDWLGIDPADFDDLKQRMII
jgi:formyl-CoA transferase